MTTDISTLSPLGPTDGNTMLGIYEDPRQPDRIIKMVNPQHDGYFAYACWLLTNQTRSPHFLKVYAVELLDPFRALVTVERLEEDHDLDYDVVDKLNYRLLTYEDPHPDVDAPTLLTEAVDLIYQDLGKSWVGDLHSGNFMTRPSDRTTVINDPLAGRKCF